MPIVVQYTSGRPFAARVGVVAEAERGVGKIVAGKQDKPLRFDLNKLDTREEKSEVIQD